jgi:hypothetical protein
MKNKNEKEVEDEGWSTIILILCLCITLIAITRLYIDATIVSDMITHYTLRGKDVIVKHNSLVFVND